MHYVTVDGSMSGTGIRDSIQGGYIKPSTLNLSPPLQERLSLWLGRYEDAHFRQYSDPVEVAELDAEGLSIARLVRDELPDSKVEYFSDARVARLDLDSEPR